MYGVPAGSTWGTPAAPAPVVPLPTEVEDAPREGGAALFPSTSAFKTSSFLMEILTDWVKVARRIIEQLDVQSLSRLVQTHCRSRSPDAEFEDWGEGKVQRPPCIFAWSFKRRQALLPSLLVRIHEYDLLALDVSFSASTCSSWFGRAGHRLLLGFP